MTPQRVTIARLGHLGDGVAPGPVFVPRTLPGETVEGVIEEGRIASPCILTPSIARVRPLCRHYKSCGGCALQHADDAFVAAWKMDVLRKALSAQGLAANLRPIATSPPGSRRRAVLSGRRTKKGALVGFHAPRSEAIVPIPDCALLHPGLIAAMPAASALTIAGGSRRAELSLALVHSEAGVDIAVTGGKVLNPEFLSILAGIAEKHDLARLTWNGEPVANRRPPAQRFGQARVVPPPGAFLQATREGEAALLAAVKEAIGGASRVADLFAGAGTFTLPLAEGAEVHAVEGEAVMLEALDKGWRMAQGLRTVSTETRDLFRRPLLPDELARFHAVLLDPPRAGAEAQVGEVAKSDLERVAMVSCNPLTFARDARKLVDAGFSLDWVQVVDQFLWSPHIELAARLSR